MAERDDVDAVARRLIEAWEKAEGKAVTPSYVASFVDMARAVLDGGLVRVEPLRVVDVNWTPTEGSVEDWVEANLTSTGKTTTRRLDRAAVTLIFENDRGHRRSVRLDEFIETGKVHA